MEEALSESMTLLLGRMPSNGQVFLRLLAFLTLLLEPSLRSEEAGGKQQRRRVTCHCVFLMYFGLIAFFSSLFLFLISLFARGLSRLVCRTLSFGLFLLSKDLYLNYIGWGGIGK